MNWHQLFTYDPESGRLFWKVRRPGLRGAIGEEAGAPCHGYRYVFVKSRKYAVHRIVWEMVHGEIPADREIDHINGDRADNRLINLRLATTVENMRNKRVHRNSATRILGVNLHGSGFKVTCLGQYVGWFSDFFDACCARKSAERRNDFHENHGRRA